MVLTKYDKHLQNHSDVVDVGSNMAANLSLLMHKLQERILQIVTKLQLILTELKNFN